jgi:hypothetical protein
MSKAASGLKMLYRKMVYVTCLASALHRAAEEIRGIYPDVDKFISKFKIIFIEFSLRTQLFKQKERSLPLPPHPVPRRGSVPQSTTAIITLQLRASSKALTVVSRVPSEL